jgi:hypothetical protein
MPLGLFWPENRAASPFLHAQIFPAALAASVRFRAYRRFFSC